MAEGLASGAAEGLGVFTGPGGGDVVTGGTTGRPSAAPESLAGSTTFTATTVWTAAESLGGVRLF